MKTLINAVLFCFVVTACSLPALSQVYRWKDKDGNLIISSTPPPPDVDAEKREFENEEKTYDSESMDEANAGIDKSSMSRTAQPFIDGVKERINYRNSIAILFDSGNLAALEDKVNELRRTRPRFSSGTPVLYDFYAAFNPVSEHISPSLKEDYANRLLKWADSNPASYIAQIAKISVLIYRGWKARGSGDASTVTKEGWKTFDENILKAWSVAKMLEERGVSDPILYHDMLVLARALGKSRSEVDAIFAKLIEIDPVFDQGYVAMAEYLLPRWHGSAMELHEFAMKSIQWTNEPVMYARIAIFVSVTEGPGMVTKYPFQYKLMKNAFEILNRRYPDSAMIVNLSAWFAFYYADKAAAKPLVNRISQEWTRDANDIWHGRNNFDQIKQQLLQ